MNTRMRVMTREQALLMCGDEDAYCGCNTVWSGSYKSVFYTADGGSMLPHSAVKCLQDQNMTLWYCRCFRGLQYFYLMNILQLYTYFEHMSNIIPCVLTVTVTNKRAQ